MLRKLLLAGASAGALAAASAATAAAGDVSLTPRNDYYQTKPDDARVFALPGNDTVQVTPGGWGFATGRPWVYLFGDLGNDTLKGGFHGKGGPGNDRIELTRCSPDDDQATDGAYAEGDEGDDVLINAVPRWAPCDRVVLRGGPGNDRLISQPPDRLWGEGYTVLHVGNLGTDVQTGSFYTQDIFRFFSIGDARPGPGRDVIIGFHHATMDNIPSWVFPDDKIDLTGADANKLRPGQQSFQWAGYGKNPGIGKVSWFRVGPNTFFHANDGVQLTEVELRGLNGPVSPWDFLLTPGTYW